MNRKSHWCAYGACAVTGLLVQPALALDPMAFGENGYDVSDPLTTVGESYGDYTPPGVYDGLGAYRLDDNTVRVLANHELLHFRGYEYQINGGAITMTGARVSYIDIDIDSRQIVDAGLAYDTVYDQNGDIPTDIGFLANDLQGLSRLCSSTLSERLQFGGDDDGDERRGVEDRIYFTGEEDGGDFNGVGGAEWALDPETRSLWAIPAMGRGAWESATEVDSLREDYVAVILSDDTSPFDADGQEGSEAAPLYLYYGRKHADGDFLDRNGLRDGTLYVWVSDTGDRTPLDFRGDGSTRSGRFFKVNNNPSGPPSEDGSTGYDEYGYPTQSNLWTQADALGAFGFSRPEDVATNPDDGTQVVFASTGVDTFAIDPDTGDGADTFGTTYIIDLDLENPSELRADITILYDGDADPARTLRSPDNLDWADDGFIYVQEDEAEEDTLGGEPLFGEGAANPNEAGIIRIDPETGELLRVATIDRDVVLDASIDNPEDADDVDAGLAGEWESSGVLDVSSLFEEAPGSLLIFNVQAHGIEDQDQFNPESRIVDGDLVEGGQLLFLSRGGDSCFGDIDGDGEVGVFDLLLVLHATGPCEGCPEDLNGDDRVGLIDIILVILNWGPC